ncbi:MAG: hypothetical protein NTY42_15720 [Planctomycetota bacterium]|nr:hypothetical protein [Planctomycetota bacterium]
MVQLRNHSLELLRNRSLVLELALVLLHSKELALVLVLRSMVLELVRSSLTSTNEASKAIP